MKVPVPITMLEATLLLREPQDCPVIKPYMQTREAVSVSGFEKEMAEIANAFKNWPPSKLKEEKSS